MSRITHTDNQHAIMQEKGNHAIGNQAERRYITHVHTQAKQEYDNQGE